MDTHPRITDSADFARELVQLEIDAHVKGVGGPIDVLRVSASGPAWVQHKPGCLIDCQTWLVLCETLNVTFPSRRIKTFCRYQDYVP
jgi:hypothetical protein